MEEDDDDIGNYLRTPSSKYSKGNNTIGKLLNLKGGLMYTNSINVVSVN